MCLFAKPYLGSIHFDGFLGTPMTYLVNVLGPLPEHWKGYFTAGTSDDSWCDQSRKPEPKLPLEAMIKRERPEADHTERNNVLSVMSKGFCYLPESRITAAQLLEDASFEAVTKTYGI